MELMRLKMSNFTCYESAEVKFNKINIFVGKNESGKTALVDALSFCLTGICRSMNKLGVGTDNLVRYGQNDMNVTMALLKDGLNIEIGRSYNVTSGQEITITENGVEKILGKEDKQKYITDLFGGDIKIIRCLFDSYGFFNLTVDEQKRLLTVISKVELDKKKVLEMIEKQFGEPTAAYAQTIVPDNIGLPMFKKFNTMITEKRKELNKKIPAQDDKTNTIDVIVNLTRKAEVENRLEAIKNDLIKDREYKDTLNQINALSQELKGYNTKPTLSLLPIEKDVKISEKPFLQTRLTALQEYKKKKADYDTVAEALKKLRDREAKILTGFCDLTDTNCPLLAKEAEGSNSAILQDIQTKIKEFEKARAPKKIENADGEIEEIQEKLNKITVAEGITTQNKTLQANYDGAVLAQKKNIDRINKSIKELQAKTDPGVDVAALETERDGLNNELGQIKSAEMNIANNENLATIKKGMQEEVENLTKLIQFFSGKQGGDDSSAEFLRLVNQATRVLVGGDVIINPEWELFLVKNNIPNPLPNCTKSVKIRIGLSFIYALGEMTGLKIAAIDDFEGVYKDNRTVILNFLKATGMQGILRMVGYDEAKHINNPEITVYRLEDYGKITIM